MKKTLSLFLAIMTVVSLILGVAPAAKVNADSDVVAVYEVKVPAKSEGEATRGNPTGRSISSMNTKNLANTVTYTGSIFQEAKVTILNYWGTWCGVCTSEMPQVKQFYQYLQNNPSYNVKLYGVVSQGNESSAQSYLSQNGYNWPNMRTDSVLQSAFYGSGSNAGDGSAPQWAAVDCNGKIIKYLNQSVTYSSLKSFADQALAIAPDNGGGNPTPSPTPGGSGTTYSGTATVQGYNYSVTVSVTKSNGMITDVNVTGNSVGNNSYYYNLAVNGSGSRPGIPQQIINNQGTSNINVISGATRTCNAIVQGANTALSYFSSTTPTPAPTATPAPISAPTVSVSIVDGKPHLTWNSVSGATRYKVKRGTGNGTMGVIATITATNYTDIAYLVQGQTYRYAVCGVSSNGSDGNYSNPVSITIPTPIVTPIPTAVPTAIPTAIPTAVPTAIPTAAPTATPAPISAPSINVTLNGSNQPVITWNAVSGAANYKVKRAALGSGTPSVIATVTGTDYTDTDNLSMGQTYTYVVCGVGSNGTEGACSAPKNITISAPLSAPTLSVSLLSSGRPKLTWTAVSGASKYQLRRAIGDGEFALVSSTTGTAYIDNSASIPGQTYNYIVCAVTPNGSAGAYSDPVSITIVGQLEAPSVSISLNSNDQPVITWNAVTGAAKYKVKRAVGNGTPSVIGTTADTSYTDAAALTPGQTYTYVVCGAPVSGMEGVCSAPQTVTIPEPLAAPSITVTINGNNQPVISWNDVSGAMNYKVKRTLGSGTQYVIATVNSTNYTDNSALIPGETYTYVVCSVGFNGAEGACSAPQTVTIPVPTAAPSITVTIAGGKPVITWNEVSGAAQYKVKRALGNGTPSVIRTVTATTYTDGASLTAGKTYTYTVCAVDASGNEGGCSAPKSITIIGKPANLTAGIVNGKPNLTWTAAQGASGYQIYRSTKKSSGYKLVATVNGTTFTDAASLTALKTYYYKVRAIDNNTNTGAFSTAVGIVAYGVGKPENFAVSLVDRLPHLTWSASQNATQYQIYRSTKKSSGYKLIAAVDGTSFTDTAALTGLKTYYYKIRATDDHDTLSEYSSVVSIVAYGIGKPAGLVIDTIDGMPLLCWDPAANAAYYNVYRSTKSSSGYKLVSSVMDPAFVDTDTLTVGKTYYYKIRAYDDQDMAGAMSAYVSIVISESDIKGEATRGGVIGDKSTAPVVTITLTSNNRPKLTWNAVSGAAKYKVNRAIGEGSFATISTLTGTTYIDLAASTPGQTYIYTVCTLAANGDEIACSVPKSITIPGGTPAPGAPSITVTLNGSNQPVISWNAVTYAVSYKISRALGNGTPTVLTTINGTSYTDTSALIPGQTYNYTVCSLGANGVEGACSVPKSITIPSAPGAPSITVTLNGSNQPVISWNAVSGASSYKVKRGLGNAEPSLIATVTGTTHTDTAALIPGQTYTYVVCSVGANGAESNCSAPKTVTIPAGGPLPAPANVSASCVNGKPVITWSAVSGAVNYRVYRATKASGSYSGVGTANGTSFTDDDALTVGKTYYYKVRAVDASGTLGTTSTYASVTVTTGTATPTPAPGGPLPAPANVSASCVNGKPVITWSAVSGAVNYRVYRATKASGSYAGVGTANGTSFTDDDALTVGKTYYYKVRAVDASGTLGTTSAYASVTVTADTATPTPAPSGTTYSGTANVVGFNYTVTVYVTKNNGTITNVSVTANNLGDSAPYYNLAINGSGSRPGIPQQIINNQGTSNIDVISGATVTCDAIVQGANAALANFPPSGPLPAPANVGASCVNGKPVITWSAVSGAVNYRVYRATKASGSYAGVGTANGTSFTDDDALTVGKTYYYKVRAVDASGTLGTTSTYTSVTVAAANALPAPTGVNVSIVNSKPVISWNAVNGALHYNVFRESDIKTYALVGITNEEVFTDNNVIEHGKYSYKVQAVNGEIVSEFSVVVSVEVYGDELDAPTGVRATIVDFKPVITWNAVAGATHYEVYREADIKTYTLVASLTETSFTDNTLLEPGVYCYKIRAVNEHSVSGYSEVVSVEVSDIKQMYLTVNVLKMQQLALIEQKYAA
ncbi:MAG: FMN-binding protein [Clostridia bacterium]|nr:FMN-binding protein [Clostridia bacterium]